MANRYLNFKVSSGLKNIVGSDLISDDFIAVFELVKNSFDAYANEVKITFDKDKILIRDDGKGMDFNDIENKWLWLGYSAKKEGEEDQDLKQKQYDDYRKKISPAKYYAGAKGIGRFSCDRLGQNLVLTSKKVSGRKIEQLKVGWGKFEMDPKVKFETIKIDYIDPPNKEYYRKIDHGTVLEISNLRSSWPRKKILDLKRSLEKLINPFDVVDQKRKSKIDSDKRKFEIWIEAESERTKDSNEIDSRNKINGPIRNFVFETLNLKTTQIFTEISEDGKKITTELIDRGELIYKISERNLEYPLLSNIRFHLFYLNQAAKYNFKVQMSISAVSFGSIFLYKNGFRVYPFGEEGEDSFGLDRRKQQGHSRYLGTREIIGRIEIYGNDEEFKETSSRDGGLKETPSYVSLEESFKEKCLKRLEKYVVDIQWSLKDSNEDTGLIESKVDAKARIVSIISKLVDVDNVKLENYNKDFLNIINDKLIDEDYLSETFENLEKIAKKTNDRGFFTELKNAKRRYEKVLKEKQEAEERARFEEEARIEAENARQHAEEERRKAEEAYEKERKRNLFFNGTGNSNNVATLGLIHHVKLTSKALNSRIKILTKDVINDKIDSKKMLEILSELKTYSEKILKLSEIVSYSDLNFKYAKHSGNIVRFIKEYLDEIRPTLDDVKIVLENDNVVYSTEFSILEVSIVLDNLISNSIKSFDTKTRKIQLDIRKSSKGIKVTFSDSGNGIDKDLSEKIFDLGFTTTRGSGIGLHMVKNLMVEMGGDIKLLNNGKILRGATFELTFK